MMKMLVEAGAEEQGQT